MNHNNVGKNNPELGHLYNNIINININNNKNDSSYPEGLHIGDQWRGVEGCSLRVDRRTRQLKAHRGTFLFLCIPKPNKCMRQQLIRRFKYKSVCHHCNCCHLECE